MSNPSSPSPRKRTRFPDDPSHSPAHSDSQDLPPPRRGKALRHDVALPLQNTSLRKLIYILVTLTTLLSAFYSYRAVQYKREVGGWWNLALGRKPPYFGDANAAFSHTKASEDTVEERIDALARALGMPSKELASAIALAVRNYVPPASLSSVAAKESGTAVRVLVDGTAEGVDVNVPTGTPSPSPGVVGSVVHGFENFVGMDEPL